jgi:hypothetical protein
VRTTLVDPDTPDSVKTKTGQDGTKLKLVVSKDAAVLLVSILSHSVFRRIQQRWTNILRRR